MPRPALPEATRARHFVAASSCPAVAHADSVDGLAGGSWRRGSDGERAWGVGKPGDGSAHYRSRSSSSPPVSMGSPNSTSSSSPDLAAILEYLTAVLEYVTTVLTLRGSCAVLLDLDLCPISTFFSISIWLLRLFWIWFGYVLWLLTWFPCQRIAPDVGNSPSSTRFARRTGGGRHPNDQTNSVFFRKHRPVMVQFAACQIDLDCLILLLHTYLCICTCHLYMHKYAIIAFPYCWFMLKNRFVFTVICQWRYGGSWFTMEPHADYSLHFSSFNNENMRLGVFLDLW